MRNLMSAFQPLRRASIYPTYALRIRQKIVLRQIENPIISVFKTQSYCTQKKSGLNDGITFNHQGSNSEKKPITEDNHDKTLNEAKPYDTSDNFEREQNAEQDEEKILKENILKASLSYVPLYGWTTEAISKGAESLGYSSMVHGMFKKGPTDLVNFFYRSCNSKLEEELKTRVEQNIENKEKTSTTNFIKAAVELRLRMNIEYIDSWPQALALHMSPVNASNGLDNIGNMLDTIWFYAGDRSHGHNFDWYTKRLSLAAVYKSTELSMIQDKSDGFHDTWDFLDRRLNEVVSAAKGFHQVASVSQDISKIGQASLLTMLNILGLNAKSRK